MRASVTDPVFVHQSKAGLVTFNAANNRLNTLTDATRHQRHGVSDVSAVVKRSPCTCT